jgi:hypothetical protein
VAAPAIAIACEFPAQRAQPLSRYSWADRQRVGAADPDGWLRRRTLWRILPRADLKPWRQPRWSDARAPAVAAKAGRVLDWYAGRWEEAPRGPNDYVVRADEQTSRQARARIHPGTPPQPGRPARDEFEYPRRGAGQDLAAGDVHRGRIFGRGEARTGIAPFGRLGAPGMRPAPDRSARRVFWIVDSGSSHRGATAVRRLERQYPNRRLVHVPIHARWLNPIAIDISIIQRKVLTPNDFPHCKAVAARLRAVEARGNAAPRPFAWRFTRADLERQLRETDDQRPLRIAACPHTYF